MENKASRLAPGPAHPHPASILHIAQSHRVVSGLGEPCIVTRAGNHLHPEAWASPGNAGGAQQSSGACREELLCWLACAVQSAFKHTQYCLHAEQESRACFPGT